MLNEEITMFEGQEVKLKTDKGVTVINLVHTARCCGLVNYDNGKNKIRWSNIKSKLSLISTTSSGDKNVSPQYIEEVNYILDEIDNSDDRNSIFMSSWLSKRFAMECSSDKAMKYKNFLASLDERREQLLEQKNQLVPSSQEIATLVSQTVNAILPALTTEIAKQFAPVVYETKNQVNKMSGLIHDQATIHEQERDELKELIGLRSVNTKRLTETLKDKLEKELGIRVNANSNAYLRAKKKIFKEFDVCKWEDIPVSKYNSVYAYIENMDI